MSNRQSPRAAALLVAVLALGLPACAARFPRIGLSGPAPLPPDPTGTSAVASYWMNEPEEPLFREVLLQSGRFAALHPDDGSARGAGSDLHLDVRLMHTSGTQSATRTLLHQIACGLTLTAIPYWGTDATQLVARVSRGNGLEKEYVIEGKVTLVAWLPMVALRLPQLAFEPFLGTSEERFYRGLFRALLARMGQDGFLSSRSATPG